MLLILLLEVSWPLLLSFAPTSDRSVHDIYPITYALVRKRFTFVSSCLNNLHANMDPNTLSIGPDRGFLEELWDGEPTFQFMKAPDLERTVQAFKLALARDPNHGQYLVFKGVPYATIERLVDNRDCTLYDCRILYAHTSKTLRIKMPSRAHDVLAVSFGQRLAFKLEPTGAYSMLTPSGPVTMHMGNVTKMPDAGWGPAGKDYLTGVLEVGYSESSPLLALDARLWLEKPESHVQHVVTAKISPTRPEIVFRKWEAERHTLTKTRSKPEWQAKVTQEARAALANETVTVSGQIDLSFIQIFERPADQAAGQGDIILTQDDLATLSRAIWVIQKFIPPLHLS